ncbi:hypothetical protein RsTz2092_00450 [Deferribacterales bacterium RsTz2092]|nr:hypothetical protein AGMMS49941_01260 [Deferribacterales bacterium]
MPDNSNEQDWAVFIKEHYKSVPFLNFVGMEVLETASGFARLRIPMKPEYSNPYGIAHGGLTAALLDTAIGVAIRTLKLKIVTLELSTFYHKPAQLDDVLFAEGNLFRGGKTVVHGTGEIFTEKDGKRELVASGRGIYYIKGEDDGIYK